jgi:hypothetical protein
MDVINIEKKLEPGEESLRSKLSQTQQLPSGMAPTCWEREQDKSLFITSYRDKAKPSHRRSCSLSIGLPLSHPKNYTKPTLSVIPQILQANSSANLFVLKESPKASSDFVPSDEEHAIIGTKFKLDDFEDRFTKSAVIQNPPEVVDRSHSDMEMGQGLPMLAT